MPTTCGDSTPSFGSWRFNRDLTAMAKVLVTGGAGFIGAHLVARLVARGDEVIVLDNMKRGRPERVEGLLRGGGGRLVEGDIRRFDALADAARGCELVFHLAAQSNVMGAG